MMFRVAAIGVAILFLLPGPVRGEQTARIDASVSRIEDFGADLRIELALSRPVPWRVFTLDEPRRLVLEFDGLDPDAPALQRIVESDCVETVSAGPGSEAGWFRVVLALTLPLRIETAGLSENGEGAALKLQLAPTSDKDFSRAAGPPTEAAAPAIPRRVAAGTAP